jgi:hypothetical protein
VRNIFLVFRGRPAHARGPLGHGTVDSRML